MWCYRRLRGVGRVLGRHIGQSEGMVLVGIEKVIQNIDVIVRSWLGCVNTMRGWYLQCYQVRGRVIRGVCFGTPETAIISKNPEASEAAIPYPDCETGPDEDVEIAVREYFDMTRVISEGETWNGVARRHTSTWSKGLRLRKRCGLQGKSHNGSVEGRIPRMLVERT